MHLKEIQFAVEVYSSIDELPAPDAALLKDAREITSIAYAPYSHFFVGAVATLANGVIMKGTNQENASYPVGICAERALLSAAATQYPGVAVNTMAITYHNENGESARPISPCGMCRQVLSEFEDRTGQPIRLILGGMSGEVYVIQTAKQLLPLTFTSDDLKK
jgi:cytidine deaminase